MHHPLALILEPQRPKTTGRDLYRGITVFGTRPSGTGSPACKIITGLLQDLPRHKGAPDRHPSPFPASTPIMREPDTPTPSEWSSSGFDSVVRHSGFDSFDQLSGSIRISGSSNWLYFDPILWILFRSILILFSLFLIRSTGFNLIRLSFDSDSISIRFYDSIRWFWFDSTLSFNSPVR